MFGSPLRGRSKTNLESQRRQYELVDVARSRGFREIEVIDDDLGRSTSGMVARPGFARFRELGSARQVLLSITAGQVHFPRPSNGERLVTFDWTPTRYRNVISVTCLAADAGDARADQGLVADEPEGALFVRSKPRDCSVGVTTAKIPGSPTVVATGDIAEGRWPAAPAQHRFHPTMNALSRYKVRVHGGKC
jgi:hypothetical protein